RIKTGSTELYYSSSWQVLEEDSGSNMQAQYVWGPVYVDALIERDTGYQGSYRVVAQQDANWNVTAIVDNLGVTQTRFVYDPYGKPSFYSSNWNSVSNNLNWVYLHQCGRYDITCGLYNFPNRHY